MAPRWFNPVFHICAPTFGKYLPTPDQDQDQLGLWWDFPIRPVCLGQEFVNVFYGRAHIFCTVGPRMKSAPWSH